MASTPRRSAPCAASGRKKRTATTGSCARLKPAGELRGGAMPRSRRRKPKPAGAGRRRTARRPHRDERPGPPRLKSATRPRSRTATRRSPDEYPCAGTGRLDPRLAPEIAGAELLTESEAGSVQRSSRDADTRYRVGMRQSQTGVVQRLCVGGRGDGWAEPYADCAHNGVASGVRRAWRPPGI